jgi:cGMP-dependent protein kinase
VNGDLAEDLYIIESGVVSIFLDSEVIIRLGPKDVFGERSILTETTRNASASASKPTVVWALSRSAFLKTLDKSRLKQIKQRIQYQDMRALRASDFTPVKLICIREAFTSFISKTPSSRLVFVKVWSVEYLKRNLELADKLKQNCILSSEADHPMIVRYIKSFKSQRSILVIRQFVTGTNFLDHIQGTVTESALKDCVSQIIIILEFLHSRKIVHRLIHPSSFMITGSSLIYLEDLKQAKRLDGRTYTIVGDPHYVSPEALTTRGYGLEADLWALGVLTFHAAYRKYPFGNSLEDPYEIYQKVAECDLVFPRRTVTSSNFGSFVKSLLKPAFDSRCKTVKEAKDHVWLAGTLWVSFSQDEIQTQRVVSGYDKTSSSTNITPSVSTRLTELLAELTDEVSEFNWDEDFD